MIVFIFIGENAGYDLLSEFSSPRNLPDPRIEPGSPALQADPLLSEPPGKPNNDSKRA